MHLPNKNWNRGRYLIDLTGMSDVESWEITVALDGGTISSIVGTDATTSFLVDICVSTAESAVP